MVSQYFIIRDANPSTWHQKRKIRCMRKSIACVCSRRIPYQGVKMKTSTYHHFVRLCLISLNLKLYNCFFVLCNFVQKQKQNPCVPVISGKKCSASATVGVKVQLNLWPVVHTHIHTLMQQQRHVCVICRNTFVCSVIDKKNKWWSPFQFSIEVCFVAVRLLLGYNYGTALL